MPNIYNYFKTYYRPNNVAIILAGDLDPAKTVEMIDKYFGNWQPANIPPFIKKAEPEITSPIVREYVAGAAVSSYRTKYRCRKLRSPGCPWDEKGLRRSRAIHPEDP